MKRYTLLVMALIAVGSLSAQEKKTDTTEKKFFVGSTLFMVMNLLDDPEPPRYAQVNFGYRLTAKDVISAEFITWNYYEPLGVPLSEKATATNFPGRVVAMGAGVSYKRFLWKNAYAQVHSTGLKQTYLNKKSEKIGVGFQMFNTLRVGYQFRFFKNRVFVEPSLACTFWPINTGLPNAFQIEEDKYPSYFLPEPGLHFGFNF